MKQVLRNPVFILRDDDEEKAYRLASRWFQRRGSKREVRKILRERGLDEEAIHAEAFRLRLDELEKIESAIADLERRFDRTLRQIARYRNELAVTVRRSSERVLQQIDLKASGPDGGEEEAADNDNGASASSQ
ncbi:hypothetical protein [Bradyrhizobium sp. DASA03120]|uniref:hypothetical protein n=1 Tax=Bradyrhizobium sp. SMVTL-02 TaxID=3395917 RepID=UPI003F7018F4